MAAWIPRCSVAYFPSARMYGMATGNEEAEINAPREKAKKPFMDLNFATTMFWVRLMGACLFL